MRAVRSRLMKWSTPSLGDTPSQATTTKQIVQGCISNTEGVTDSDKPSLIFIVSSAPPKSGRVGASFKTASKKTAKVTRRPNDSVYVRDLLFENEKDFRVHVAAGFFNCLYVDVTSVSREQNRVLNSDTAPAVILANKDGSISHFFVGRSRIKPSILLAAMCSVLSKNGYKNVPKTVSGVAAMTKALIKTEINIIDKEGEIEIKTKKYEMSKSKNERSERAKGEMSRSFSSSVARNSEGQLAKLKSDLEKDKQRKESLLDKEQRMLVASGLDRTEADKNSSSEYH